MGLLSILLLLGKLLPSIIDLFNKTPTEKWGDTITSITNYMLSLHEDIELAETTEGDTSKLESLVDGTNK